MAAGNLECDTQLCLTAGGSPRSSSNGAGAEQKHAITIFYGGRVCVCDATEIQARAIISMARREMEETAGKRRAQSFTLRGEAATQRRRDLQLLNPRLSMKKSLQRFLQKRKSRVCDNIHHQRSATAVDQEAAPDASSFS
ncbi:Protein TIFY 5A [Platanthera zijinensis]|uniref:Protein TIFY n=1 Tax=Platanthera zijinensis TaxID=2320716 RepID=A0AAP0BWZ1_9ASPA